MTAQAMVETKGLSKVYDSCLALSQLSLEVRAGESFCLLGPNGAGKTTTIRLLMGLLRPTGGEARIAGLDCFAERADAKRYVGYLPDEPVFPDYLQGIEIVRFMGAMHGLSPELIAERTDPLLKRLELTDAGEEFATNYSQGMRKKLALVCALVHDPKLLILDEPTAGLDPYATRTLLEMIGERVEAGHSVLLSTHLLEQAERMCDRVGILFEGKLAAVGPMPELRAQAGVGEDASLEDLFFAFTGGQREDAQQ